ncbi:FHA domain-containing protein [Acidovorax sp. A1169]|uniref:FHA domain-containing protein n=1 Tax=Acidovorax sp. A1169 TaxID=3059524 RepID=UPI002737A295|nr:FHA domain-containing protein [Acidovorax sp. A1169]MDP4075687.1 FHA domain-containing protein [Acidovorax sp. A1169]
MPRMIVSIDGVVIKEVQLTKDRTTLGRRPYNDIVIDNLAVSGEHAIFHMVGNDVEIEDLGSTNGTYVNAKAVKRQELRNGDTVEVGKYKIRFMHEAEGENFEKTMIFKPGMVPPLGAVSRPAGLPGTPPPAPITAVIKVMSGAAAGREVSLLKVVTTIGKPGVAVASITKRHHGFVLAHVEGPDMPLLNGSAIGLSPVPLKHGDKLELAGTEMQFEQT